MKVELSDFIRKTGVSNLTRLERIKLALFMILRLLVGLVEYALWMKGAAAMWEAERREQRRQDSLSRAQGSLAELHLKLSFGDPKRHSA